MNNTVGRQILSLSQEQQDIIVGCLLGDGRLESRSIEDTARLRIHHADSQKKYVLWKYKKFHEFVSRKPRHVYCGTYRKTGKKYYSWYFHTVTLLGLRELYREFYPISSKKVPMSISELLTPQALAVWLMDDGCNDGKSVILNTQNFEYSDQLILMNVLEEKYGLKATINRDRKNYRLRFSQKSFDKLSEIVKPYIIQSMLYKICPCRD